MAGLRDLDRRADPTFVAVYRRPLYVFGVSEGLCSRGQMRACGNICIERQTYAVDYLLMRAAVNAMLEMADARLAASGTATRSPKSNSSHWSERTEMLPFAVQSFDGKMVASVGHSLWKR